MDWRTFYIILKHCSLWIERTGQQWQLHMMPKTGGNYYLGHAASPELCAAMLSSAKPFPQGWIKVGKAGT
jgi:hypothetical protein